MRMLTFHSEKKFRIIYKNIFKLYLKYGTMEKKLFSNVIQTNLVLVGPIKQVKKPKSRNILKNFQTIK